MRTVAAFDFDGTLSSRDNFLRFVRLVAGNADTARAMAAAVPSLLASRKDKAQRDVAKATVLRQTLGGRREDSLRDLGTRFARLVVERHLNPHVVERLDAHRALGHELVIVSASLTLYLDPVAELLGIPTVLATAMEVDADGRLTGEMTGENVRGPEKARRLDAWLDTTPDTTPDTRPDTTPDTRTGDTSAVVFAYGDSHGDTELLARADHPVLVDAKGRVPADAAPVADPPPPGTDSGSGTATPRR